MKTIISLIGQQPIPNLLPLLDLRPDTAVLVYSEFTKPAYDTLRKLLKEKGIKPVPLPVDAYNILAIEHDLEEKIAAEKIDVSNLIVNITGGTKIMSLAAWSVAAKLNLPFVYLQSEGKQSVLYEYAVKGEGEFQQSKRRLPVLLTIDDYLRAHVGRWNAGGLAKGEPGRSFEKAILDALQPVVDEIVAGAKMTKIVDIDLVVRCGNQIGIIEAKTGSNGIKKAIDQLNTAGGQRYLGTYTKRFLVSNLDWGPYSDLHELAAARNITVIQLPGFGETGMLNDQELELLRTKVLQVLGCVTTGSIREL